MSKKLETRYGFKCDMHFQTLVGVHDIPAILRLDNGFLEIEIDTLIATAIWVKHYAPDLSEPEHVGVFHLILARNKSDKVTVTFFILFYVKLNIENCMLKKVDL